MKTKIFAMFVISLIIISGCSQNQSKSRVIIPTIPQKTLNEEIKKISEKVLRCAGEDFPGHSLVNVPSEIYRAEGIFEIRGNKYELVFNLDDRSDFRIFKEDSSHRTEIYYDLKNGKIDIARWHPLLAGEVKEYWSPEASDWENAFSKENKGFFEKKLELFSYEINLYYDSILTKK